MNKVDTKSFSDNVFQAYTLIEKDHSGVKGSDLSKLAQMLLLDYPNEVLQGVLRMIDKKDAENVEFNDFLTSIRTILAYDGYFQEMEHLFKHLDRDKRGKISRLDFIAAIKKLSAARSDIRVPPVEEVESVCK